jgi:hypothetical protein
LSITGAACRTFVLKNWANSTFLALSQAIAQHRVPELDVGFLRKMENYRHADIS